MHTCIYSQACKCCTMNTFVMNRCCANSHMSFPWLLLTLRTFLYTCMCSQEYIDSPRHVDNSIKHICVFMYLFIYLSIYLTNIHISYDGHFCTRTHGAETLICLCPCERSQWEPLGFHTDTHKYTCFRSQILLYNNPRCGNSHMSVPLRALTVRTSLLTCIYPHIFMYRMMDTFV